MIDVAAAVIVNNNKILICKRPENKSMGGLWEFPGGKKENDESIEKCIVREIKEELGLNIISEKKLTTAITDKIKLHVYKCKIISGIINNKEHTEVKWIKKEELDKYEYPPSDIIAINQIKWKEVLLPL